MLLLRLNCFLTLLIVGLSYGQEKVLVGAASDLKFALDSVIARYNLGQRYHRIEVTYSSSGKLFEQISHGAPYDIFFSADTAYPAKLKENGLVIGDLHSYGIGRIVIWSKKIDPIKGEMNSLINPLIRKISIANPAHAPYGKRAAEALTYYALYQKVLPLLVYGENISQAAQFVTSGAADAGIIALSLAISPAMQKEKGSYFLIPREAHTPLDQAFVLLTHAKANGTALAFIDFVRSDEAKRILRHFGFLDKQQK
ncbi:MAG: molybdate ABC transporter substrate-binding protein [Chryseolinea sp.]